MATLYELIIGEGRALDELLEEFGDFTPEIEQLLEELEIKVEQKLERIGIYYAEQLAEAEQCKQLATHYAARGKSFERGAEGLKNYAERLMRAAGIEKVKGALVTLAIQKNNPAVHGELDEFQLRNLAAIEPAMVKHIPESFSLVKAEVLAAHKAGRLLPKGLTVESSSSLRIR